MRIGIMQPYLFPYLGYFQLIEAVDLFVVYDDVQWMKGGWINRNRILVKGEPQFISLPVRKDSTFSKINEREFASHTRQAKQKTVRKIREAYSAAPYAESVMPLINRCFGYNNCNVCEFIVNSLTECCQYLGVNTPFRRSSELKNDDAKKGPARVIEVNKSLGADCYINLSGGRNLYDRRDFVNLGIDLKFLKSKEIRYDQYSRSEFVASLSIIDVMMFNSVADIRELLQEFELE